MKIFFRANDNALAKWSFRLHFYESDRIGLFIDGANLYATARSLNLDIDYRKLHEYKLGQAIALLALMVAYALLLRPAGFLLATSGFLIGGSVLLGERRWVTMIVVAAIATFGIWYLVQEVLGIFLRPLPFFMGV